MTCAACLKRGKTWQGGDPRCAFENGEWSEDNWCCATDGMVRDLVDDDYVYCEDMKFATVNAFVADLDSRPLALWVAWYKRRGATDQMWLLFDDLAPRRPTEAECLAIVAANKPGAA